MSGLVWLFQSFIEAGVVKKINNKTGTEILLSCFSYSRHSGWRFLNKNLYSFVLFLKILFILTKLAINFLSFAPQNFRPSLTVAASSLYNANSCKLVFSKRFTLQCLCFPCHQVDGAQRTVQRGGCSYRSCGVSDAFTALCACFPLCGEWCCPWPLQHTSEGLQEAAPGITARP